MQRQLAAAQQRLDQAIAAWNLALEQGALPDAALEKALDEAADVFVLRRDEAGRQLGRDAVLAAIRQLETTVTEDHRAFVVLTREDGSSRRLVLHNDGNRPRYVDSDHCSEEAIISKTLDLADRRKRLVPLVFERVELPIWLHGLVGIDFTPPVGVDPIERLLALMKPQPSVSA